MNTTIVTGFIDLSQQTSNQRKSSSTYHNYAKNFLFKLPIPLVCFVESESIDFVRTIRTEYGYQDITVVEPISFNQLSLYPFLSTINLNYQKHCNKESIQPYCPEYLIVVNGKADMLSKVSKTNPFNSTHLLWLDYGIMGRNYNTALDLLDIYSICRFPKEKISFAIIDDNNLSYNNLMMGWKWVTAGGLFTIPVQDCIKFTNDWISEAINSINKGLYPMEESIFLWLWKRNQDKYNVFYANYDTLGIKYLSNCKSSQSKDAKKRIVYVDPTEMIKIDKKGLYRVELVILSLAGKFGIDIVYKRPILLKTSIDKHLICDYIEMLIFEKTNTIFRHGLEQNLYSIDLYEQIKFLFK